MATETSATSLSDEMEAWLFDLQMMEFGHGLPGGVPIPTKVQEWAARVREIEQRNDDRRRKFPARRNKGDTEEHREQQRVEALSRETALILSQRDGKAILCKKGYCVTTAWDRWPIPRHIVAVLLRIMAAKFDQAEEASDD